MSGAISQIPLECTRGCIVSWADNHRSRQSVETVISSSPVCLRMVPRRAVEYNKKMEARYAKSAFGGVDIWIILGAVGDVRTKGSENITPSSKKVTWIDVVIPKRADTRIIQQRQSATSAQQAR